MMTIKELAELLKRLTDELDARTARHQRVMPYARRCKGDRHAIPEVIKTARLTRAYNRLMAMSTMPWGKLIVTSKLDRLEPIGIETGDDQLDRVVWRDVWQANSMDLEAKLGHRAALLDGRAHALVWPDKDGKPEVTLDDATQMIVAYREGRRRDPVAALRRWGDGGDDVYAVLYTPEWIYKVRKARNDAERINRLDGTDWIMWQPAGDDTWPLVNPFGVVPVTELAVNRELEPGEFAYATGEFENEVGLIDRINLLTFLGLIVAIWMGFPLRYVIGDTIKRDDDDKPLPPFESRPDSLAQLEDPEAKIGQLAAADRSGLSIFDELAQLAAATSTPRHYFPMAGGVNNVSAETILAFEGGMHATLNGSHKPSLGEGWEQVVRLGAMMLSPAQRIPQHAALKWADHESRSLGERADAFVKLASQMPWMAAAELALNVDPEFLRRIETEQAGSAVAKLLEAANTPEREPEPEPAPPAA